MGQPSNGDDFGHFDSHSMYGTDGGFTAVAGSFDVSLYFAEAEVVCDFATILSSHLSGVGGVLLGTAEAHLACGRPGNHLSFAVG